jgi:UDP-N-acetylmuramyl pentapeptide phosphotransferase/UDP-N-acetylglucosamine-1-phosphate transferase/O-antigen ligase
MLAWIVAYAATPVAVRVANRLQFFDKPFGYKGHAVPTPYLGGAAVVGAFVVASLVVAGHFDRTVPVVCGALILWVVGTIDDRRNLSPYLRLAIEVAMATGLWALGLGWDLGFGGAVDLVVTCLWIAGVVNAFNLFDNMDGAASTMAAVVAGAVAVLGAVLDEVWLAAVAAALCGACLGFLPYNLSRPARIFLGDGGSMPVGFVAASLVMIGASDAVREWQALAIALLLVGIPLLDTTLVVISRRRRGIPILTGGRDHLTHRTRQRIASARAVAVALGGAQAMLAAFALLAYRGGSFVVVVLVALYVLAAAAAIELLDGGYGTSERVAARPVGWRPRPADAVCAVLGVVLALSPFYDGGYDSSMWAPAGVVLLALLTAVVIARFPRLTGPALLAVGSLAGLAVWALLSGLWSPSPIGASVFGDRLVVYAVLLAVLALLIRDLRSALWAMGAVVAGTAVVAGWTVVIMLFGDGPGLFAAGRLNDPLGYINAQGGLYAFLVVPCLLAAEWGRPRWAAATAAGLASAFSSLAVLSQSRGAWLALGAAVVVALVAAPGRRWRVAALVPIVGSVAVAGPWLNHVYTATVASVTSEGSIRAAAVALVVAALAAGVIWWTVLVWAQRVSGATAARVARCWTWALAAVAAVAVVATLVASPRIVDAVDTQWHDFATLQTDTASQASGSRLLSGSGVRYDYWRIALNTWEEHPIAGVGAGGYGVPYLQHRRTTEDVRQPHSLELQVLSETGVVGIALLIALLAALVWAVVRAMRSGATRADRLASAGGAALFAAWLAQTSGDWLHLLTGVTGVALLGAAVLVRPVRESAREQRSVWTVRGVAVAGSLIAVLALVLLSRQALSEHYRTRAQEALAAQVPADALELANRSLRLQGSDVNSRYLRASALERLGRTAEARAALRRALDDEPDNYVTWALLGDLDARHGDDAAARVAYRRASQLNPGDADLAALAAGKS